MTDEQINFAIAETCGWKCAGHPEQVKATEGWEFGYQFVINPDGELVTHNSIPDYCNDLNAMHEAEKVLDWQGKIKFTEILYRHCPDSYIREYDETEWDEIFPLINSTARQRAQAFLKAIGKWEQK